MTAVAADWMEQLFGHMTAEDRAADAAAWEAKRAAEKARTDAIKARHAAEESARRLRPVCGRCHGAGRIGAFSHVAGGACFECGGDGRK